MKTIIAFVAGVASVLLGGWILCEVAEHCDLPLEVDTDDDP